MHREVDTSADEKSPLVMLVRVEIDDDDDADDHTDDDADHDGGGDGLRGDVGDGDGGDVGSNRNISECIMISHVIVIMDHQL